MLKNFTRLFFFLTLFTVFGVIYPPHVGAQQPVGVFPTALYRFQISYADGGYLLTHYYAEGSANGHPDVTFIHPFFNAPMGIYRPPDGYTPDASSGLVRLHRWRVVQGGWRVYYYYSTYYAEHGSDYFYEGVAGWVFQPGLDRIPTNGAPLAPLNIWYSTDLGFWYEFRLFDDQTAEWPPNRPGKNNYAPQGRIASLPPACINPEYPSQVTPGEYCVHYVVQFNPPPPPPPPPPPGTCNASPAIKSRCFRFGGDWNNETCSCEYY
jgi:hypothetical protein